jgi:Cu(I)/Ag(I) efflux system membrane protein CusA/SilA
VLAAVPFSLVGAIWLLYLLDYNMSVAVKVGLIAPGSMPRPASSCCWAEGRLQTQDDLREAIVDGAARRIRPKLMTVLTMMIGLVPVLWSAGTGADVMKRIAGRGLPKAPPSDAPAPARVVAAEP